MRAISLRHKHLKLDQKKSTLPSGTLAWNQNKRPLIGRFRFWWGNNNFLPP